MMGLSGRSNFLGFHSKINAELDKVIRNNDKGSIMQAIADKYFTRYRSSTNKTYNRFHFKEIVMRCWLLPDKTANCSRLVGRYK
jgi:hypothetical protein